MESNQFTRRDFLKIISLLPYFFVGHKASKISSPFDISPDRKNLPNILILVFDAFSASNCSLYGYPRPTTPNIERFASRATLFHQHYAGGNFTSPGTATLLTGTYPWTHRVFHFLGSVEDHSFSPNLFDLLEQDYHTFAYTHNPLVFVLLHQFRQSIRQLSSISELCLSSTSLIDRLLGGDYPVALESENLLFRNLTYPSASMFLSNVDALKRFYLHTSFNKQYGELFPRGVPRFSLEAPPGFIYFLLEDAINWMQKQVVEAPQPFFGYVHLFPPHSPYVTRQEFINKFDDGWEAPFKKEHYSSDQHSRAFIKEQRRLYDESILYVDAEFGRLYDFLESNGILENTYLFLTSDHGEMFERGIVGHNTPTLYEPIVKVPMIVSSPGQLQRRDIHTLTGNVDVLPTLAKIARINTPTKSEGFPLPIKSDERIEEIERSLFVVEAKENPKNPPLRKATIVLIKKNLKLIHTLGHAKHGDDFEMYDICNDPEELTNIYKNSESSSARMKEELLTKIAEIN